MKALLLAMQIFVVVAPPPPSQEEAARILAQAPGLSNRTGWRPAPAAVPGWPRFPIGNNGAGQAEAKAESSRPGRSETEAGRAIRMGIPGGWTPLEWAILHSSGPLSGGRK